jgi:hypothetical protein
MDATILVYDNHTANVSIFDLSAALDPRLSDRARGLHFRLCAISMTQLRLYKRLSLTMTALLDAMPDDLISVQSSFRELMDAGYVKRQKDSQGQWVIELSMVPPDADQMVIIPRVPKKKPAKPKTVKRTYPGMNQVKDWLESPHGGDYVVFTRDWPRVMQSLKDIFEFAYAREWLDEHWNGMGNDEPDGIEDVITYIAECWAWVRSGTPYRGKPDIHNVAKQMQVWWDTEGRAKYESTEIAGSEYTPVIV